MIYSFVVRNETGTIEKIISFDSVTSVSRSLSGTVTKNAVENGLPISDHMSLENPKFDISGVVSSYNILDEALELVWNGTTFESKGDAPSFDRHLEIELELERLWKERTVFSILRTKENSDVSEPDGKYSNLSESKVAEYLNCVITNLVFPEEAGEFNVIKPKMSIEQVNVAYVSKEKLKKEEQQPALTPIQKQPQQLGSANTSTTNSKDESGVGIGEKVTDNSNIAKALDKKNGNLEEVAKTKREIADVSWGIAQQEKAIYMQQQGIPARVIPNVGGTGYTLETKK